MTTALFTGAGASKSLGYALTREMLPRIRNGLRRAQLFDDLVPKKQARSDRVELAGLLDALLPGMNRLSDDDLPLVTDLFSLVDYALVSGDALPGINQGEAGLLRCRELLKQAITDVLLEDFVAAWDTKLEEHRRQMAVKDALVKWLHNNLGEVGLISTNYDIGIEFELYGKVGQRRVYKDIDLGFDWRYIGKKGDVRTRPAQPKIRVYKLHGSFDTLRCSMCGHVYFNPWGSIATWAFYPKLVRNNRCHCNSRGRLGLHIVSPSHVRQVRDANLLSVWRSALEWLRTSSHWVLVGYSLPPEDLAIKSLLMRAYDSAKRHPRVTVVQTSLANKPRFEALFPGCQYRCDGLEGYLEV